MREIRMITMGAGPEGVRLPGTVHAVAGEEARELVKGGYAEYATVEPAETQDARPRGKKAAAPPKEG